MLISYHKPYKHIGLYCSFKRTKSVFKLGKRGPKPKFYDAYHKTQRRLVRESYYRKKLKEKGFNAVSELQKQNSVEITVSGVST